MVLNLYFSLLFFIGDEIFLLVFFLINSFFWGVVLGCVCVSLFVDVIVLIFCFVKEDEWWWNDFIMI